jgi:hypothetical protein
VAQAFRADPSSLSWWKTTSAAVVDEGQDQLF